METTVKQRLISFIEFKGLSKNRFETICGLSTRYVSNIVNSIPPKTIEKITLNFPELNLEWLLVGRGEMIRGAVLVEGGNGNVAKDEFYEARLDKLLNIIESQQHTIKTLVCRLGELENP